MPSSSKQFARGAVGNDFGRYLPQSEICPGWPPFVIRRAASFITVQNGDGSARLLRAGSRGLSRDAFFCCALTRRELMILASPTAILVPARSSGRTPRFLIYGAFQHSPRHFSPVPRSTLRLVTASRIEQRLVIDALFRGR